MKPVLLVLTVLILIGAAVAFSGSRAPADKNGLIFTVDGPTPATHLNINQNEAEFQFAIVSDRTGSHRANIFAQAVEKLNLLQPAFVISVGDLIEGGNKKPETLAAEWKELDGFLQRLNMPFFYGPGNHDVGAEAAAEFWKKKLGRTYYHFVHRDVLFLVLNSDDPAGSKGNIDKEQIAYAQKVLKDNRDVRWTIVIPHRPLWSIGDGKKNGWSDIEDALQGRKYTVFAGHVHKYQKFVRHGQNYYQLATTGGGSLLRGPDQGEFDHITWVTMKKDGPLLANILLDSIVTENLQRPITDEPVKSKAKPTVPAKGQVSFEGSPIPGAVVVLQPTAKDKGAQAVGIVAADGSFQFTTYAANDGAVEGDYAITVTWRKDLSGRTFVNQLPGRYADSTTSELRTTIRAGSDALVLKLRK